LYNTLVMQYHFHFHCLTRMWANAQRDGRPAKYRWHPLFNAAKFGWRLLLECRAVMLPRRKSRRNLLGCPKLTKRSQLLVGQGSPYCEDMWRSYCCLTSFFLLSKNTHSSHFSTTKCEECVFGEDDIYFVTTTPHFAINTKFHSLNFCIHLQYSIA